MIKKTLNTVIISFTFAMLQAEPTRITYKKSAPIVYELDQTPTYTRKRPLIKRVKLRDLDLV